MTLSFRSRRRITRPLEPVRRSVDAGMDRFSDEICAIGDAIKVQMNIQLIVFDKRRFGPSHPVFEFVCDASGRCRRVIPGRARVASRREG